MEKFIVDVPTEVTKYVNVPTEFTQYDLDCIWSSALSGISYWAVLEKIDRSNLLVEENYNGYIDGKMPLDDMLTRGVVFKLRDIDDDDNKPKIFILNLEKLKLGVQRYYAYGNGKKKGFNFKTRDIDNMDAGDADIIVQLGLFNNIVYG